MDNSFDIAWDKAIENYISKQTNILCYNIEELGELSITSGESIDSEDSIDAPSTEQVIRACAYEGANYVNNPQLENKIYNLLKITSPYIINSHDTIYNTCVIILDPDSNETNQSGSVENLSNEMLSEESDNIE